MIATAEHHVRVMRHLMEYAGLSRDRAEFLAVEAWAAVAPIVEAALLAERDELREALRALVEDTEGDHDEWRCAYPDRYPACTDDAPQCGRQQTRAKARAALSRHPSQPVKGTPGG